MTSADRKIEPVRPYKVILLDDHVTTFDFVIRILISVFQKDHPTAVVLTMEVHRSGSSHVATLPREMAELRQMQVHDAARKEGFPFRCVIEPA
ncbi:MAG: ATP-dependent Clp protease adaptor ClpS [Nitrospirae bacterium]|nr:ATP-dependent Clp protease adaptor ClpS [Nitrospirota bacterium]MBI3593767.1 ATP-dependent Clp protease adaptor ClpS [Nitrospirota bacterium]